MPKDSWVNRDEKLGGLLEELGLFPKTIDTLVLEYESKKFRPCSDLIMCFLPKLTTAFFEDSILFAGHNEAMDVPLYTHDLLSTEKTVRVKLTENKDLLVIGLYPKGELFVWPHFIILGGTQRNKRPSVAITELFSNSDRIRIAPSASKNNLVYVFNEKKIVLIDSEHQTHKIISPEGQDGAVMMDVSLNDDGSLLVYATGTSVEVLHVKCNESGVIELEKKYPSMNVGSVISAKLLHDDILFLDQKDTQYIFYKVTGEKKEPQLLHRRNNGQSFSELSYNVTEDLLVALVTCEAGMQCDQPITSVEPFFKNTRILVVKSTFGGLQRSLSVSPNLNYVLKVDDGQSDVYRISE